jgi:hypothetical protein
MNHIGTETLREGAKGKGVRALQRAIVPELVSPLCLRVSVVNLRFGGVEAAVSLGEIVGYPIFTGVDQEVNH